MTPYDLIWLPDAEDQLAEIWLRARDRADVTAAQAEIDARLAHDPATKGSEVAEGLRQITVPPLKAFFEVHEVQHQVHITAVDRAR
jgi:hypothetical protein